MFSSALPLQPKAAAAKLSAADRVWIDACVAQRRESKAKPAALRNYCICMHEVVDDNRPFDITELRAYLPTHTRGPLEEIPDALIGAFRTPVDAIRKIPISAVTGRQVSLRYAAGRRGRP